MSLSKTVSFVLICLCCALLGFTPSRSLNRQDQQQQLIQLEERWLAAEDNPQVLGSILADDFIHVLPSGFVTKADQIRYLRSHPGTHEGATKHFEDLNVRIYGDAGVVNGIVVATDAAGKVRKTLFTDVFRFRSGKWQAVNAQELPLTQTGQR